MLTNVTVHDTSMVIEAKGLLMTGLHHSKTHTSLLPPAYLPVALSREQAAAVIAVSPTTFDKLVKDRLMPRGKKLYGCRRWDRDEVIAAWRAIPGEDAAEAPSNDPWSSASWGHDEAV